MELAVEVGGVPQLGRGWAPLVCQGSPVRLPVGAAVPLHTSLPLDMAVVGSLTGVRASENDGGVVASAARGATALVIVEDETST